MEPAISSDVQWLQQRTASVSGLVRLAGLAGAAAVLAHVGFAAALAFAVGTWVQGRFDTGWQLLAMVLAIGARSGLLALRDHAGGLAGLRLRQQVRAEVLDTLERLGPLRGHAGDDGALSTLVTEQVDALDGHVSRYLPQRLTIALALPTLLLAVTPFSWMALLILAGTAPLIPVFMHLVGRGAAAASQRQADALARLGGQFLDLVRGLPMLRLLGQVMPAAARLGHGIEDYRTRTMQVLRLAFLSSMVLELFASLSIAMLALYLGLSLLGRLDIGHYGQTMTLGPALFMLLLAPEFYAPLRQLGADYHVRADALAAAARLRGLQAQLPAAATAAAAMPASTARSDPAAPLIVFEHVGLRHADGRVALENVCFTVNAGERIALRGASGSGKSTLLALAAGLIQPTSGRILIHGQALDTTAWWPRLGWMEQRPEWFFQSIRDNVLVGQPADEARLWQALTEAGLDEVVRALPSQANAVVGSAQGTLSGGQLQRLALARALARDADVWLLDEPFSQLDAETGMRLRHTLGLASHGRTVLMATHESEDPDWINRTLLLERGRLLADSSRPDVPEPGI